MAKNIGGVWVKKTKNGEDYLFISVEINGEKKMFSAFKNSYKEEGDNKPEYSIAPPRNDNSTNAF